jgi:hypothetical protein
MGHGAQSAGLQGAVRGMQRVWTGDGRLVDGAANGCCTVARCTLLVDGAANGCCAARRVTSRAASGAVDRLRLYKGVASWICVYTVHGRSSLGRQGTQSMKLVLSELQAYGNTAFCKASLMWHQHTLQQEQPVCNSTYLCTAEHSA